MVQDNDKLAVLGGTPIRAEPYPAWPQAERAELEQVGRVLEGQRWFAGPRGDDPESLGVEFARRFAKMHGADFAHPVANGSVAIEIALRALGVSPGDEVIVPCYTFLSTATSVLMLGAIPVFADIDPRTYCLDPADVARKISEATAAVIPVHLGGQMADMPALQELCKGKGIAIVEDCAQAIGAGLPGGRAGTWGQAATFSFQSNKTITAGEGGLVMAGDPEIAERLRAFTAFGRLAGEGAGRSSAYVSQLLSSNYRLSEMQAAVLLAQLEKFPGQDQRRQENAAYLNQDISQIPGLEHISDGKEESRHGYYYYLLRYQPDEFAGLAPQRLAAALAAEGVPFLPGDTAPIYHNPVFRPENLTQFLCPEVLERYRTVVNLDDPGCPQAEEACNRTLILRHQVLLGSREDMDDILEALAKVRRLCPQLTDK